MNKVKKVVHAVIWVFLGLVLVGMVGSLLPLAKLLTVVISVLVSNSGWAATNPERWGGIIGEFVGRLTALLIVAFLWFKTLRWLRRAAASRALSSTPISVPGQS